MARFHRIYQVRPGGNPFVACLDHVGDAFANATGLPLVYGTGIKGESIPGRSIVIGAHLCRDATAGDGCAIWNTEQVFAGSTWLRKDYVALCRQGELWDYDPANVEGWREVVGIEARLARLLYDPTMVRPALANRVPNVPIFYGSTHMRRECVVRAAGASRVGVAFGDDLDRALLIASCVLNIHYYEAAVLETVRLSYLWANGVPVISEDYRGPDFWRDLMPAGTFVPYSELAERVIAGDIASGSAQREAYQATSLADELKPLL